MLSETPQEALSLAKQLLVEPANAILAPSPLNQQVTKLTQALFKDLQHHKYTSVDDLQQPKKKRKLQSDPVPLHLHQLHADQIWEQIDRVVKAEVTKVSAKVFQQIQSINFNLLASSAENDVANVLERCSSNSEADVEALEGDIRSEEDLGTDCSEEEQKETDKDEEVDEMEPGFGKQKGKKKSPLDDEFFNLDEMESFVKAAEKEQTQKTHKDDGDDEDDDDDDDDDDENDDDDDDDDENGDDEDDNEDDDSNCTTHSDLENDCDNKDKFENSDDEEQALELLLDSFESKLKHKEKKRKNSVAESDEDDEGYENESNISERELVNGEEHLSNDNALANRSNEVKEENKKAIETQIEKTVDEEVEDKIENGSSLLVQLSARERQLHDAVEQMERELVGEKHWSLMGESGAKHREPNSLLSLHLELPQYCHQRQNDLDAFPDTLGTSIGNADDVDEVTKEMKGSELVSQVSNYIERLVKERIRDLVFDDVERKYEVSPAERQKLTENDDPLAGLDFKKSRIGLGDVYAEQYAVEMLGGKTRAETELDKKKVAMTQLFAKIMYKLDSLSHERALPKPFKNPDGTPKDIGAITVEDTIPVVISMAQRATPEETFVSGHEKQKNEMTPEERKALRNSIKERRRKKILGKVKSSEMSIRDMVKRKVHLQQKNKDTKEDKKTKRTTGLSSKQLVRGREADMGKRVKVNELLARAVDHDKASNSTRGL